jgi:uncharacterized protein
LNVPSASVPLFPLPEACLFPGQVLPLHIFEPRYRAMVADAAKGDRQIAVAMLRAGYEPLYFTNSAPIEPVVGVGRIIKLVALPDGRYNLLLLGVSRARVVSESRDGAYRRAEVELIQTRCDDRHECGALRRELLERARSAGVALCSEIEAQSLGAVADGVASCVPMTPPLRQVLLAESDDLARARTVLAHLECLSRRCAAPRSVHAN